MTISDWLYDPTVQRGLAKLHSLGHPVITWKDYPGGVIVVEAGGYSGKSESADAIEALAELVREILPPKPGRKKQRQLRVPHAAAHSQLPLSDRY